MLVHNECKNAWNQYQQDHKHDLNPETGKKYTRSELAAKYNAEKPPKVVNSNGKIHGNSLDYEGINYGYVLKDTTTGEVLKYGESINPQKRYTKAYLEKNNAKMYILTEGTKRDVHQWQIDFNNIFKQYTGRYPRLNINGH